MCHICVKKLHIQIEQLKKTKKTKEVNKVKQKITRREFAIAVKGRITFATPFFTKCRVFPNLLCNSHRTRKARCCYMRLLYPNMALLRSRQEPLWLLVLNQGRGGRWLYCFPPSFLDPLRPPVGFPTSCSRFSKTFPVISKKVGFSNESCSKVAPKNKHFFWSDAKICKFYNKSTISKLFCAILQRNQRC